MKSSIQIKQFLRDLVILFCFSLVGIFFGIWSQLKDHINSKYTSRKEFSLIIETDSHSQKPLFFWRIFC